MINVDEAQIKELVQMRNMTIFADRDDVRFEMKEPEGDALRFVCFYGYVFLKDPSTGYSL